jgi:Flp pilus assembly protein protease CpaA
LGNSICILREERPLIRLITSLTAVILGGLTFSRYCNTFWRRSGGLSDGAVLHYFRLFGGGDVKLLAAIAIWTGTASLGAFLFLVAIIGGCSCGSNFDHRSLQ